ncbi:MAG: hypothetical protein ACLFQM_04220 [Fidelibacterota bacterium]
MVKQKIFKISTFIIRITLIIAFITAIITHAWLNSLISIVALILTLIPYRIEDRYKIKIPLDFEIAIVLFLFASLFLGEIGNFYDRFWWWDILLHFISAIAFGCIGFIILYYLNKTNKISSKPFWIAVFTFSFAVSIGTVWEIFEFSVDQLLGLNMQKTGLHDTMWDLITDVTGALIAALAGYGYMTGSQKSYLSRLIAVFIKENPKIDI